MKAQATSLIGRMVVSEESGRKFGVVNDISFITDTGELMNITLKKPTKHVADLDLQRDEKDNYLVPFSAVRTVGDFVIISEKDL